MRWFLATWVFALSATAALCSLIVDQYAAAGGVGPVGGAAGQIGAVIVFCLTLAGVTSRPVGVAIGAVATFGGVAAAVAIRTGSEPCWQGWMTGYSVMLCALVLVARWPRPERRLWRAAAQFTGASAVGYAFALTSVQGARAPLPFGGWLAVAVWVPALVALFAVVAPALAMSAKAPSLIARERAFCTTVALFAAGGAQHLAGTAGLVAGSVAGYFAAARFLALPRARRAAIARVVGSAFCAFCAATPQPGSDPASAFLAQMMLLAVAYCLLRPLVRPAAVS